MTMAAEAAEVHMNLAFMPEELLWEIFAALPDTTVLHVLPRVGVQPAASNGLRRSNTVQCGLNLCIACTTLHVTSSGTNTQSSLSSSTGVVHFTWYCLPCLRAHRPNS